MHMRDLIGQQLGNYRLTTFLGKGGFARVYLGEHIFLGRQAIAAIKVINETKLSDEVIQGFITEARTIRKLNHPHIVKLLEFGIDGSNPYLVMDYAPYGSLRNRHPRNTAIPILQIASYVNQVADGLQFAHDQGIVHCNVKPENMLEMEANYIVLSDFEFEVTSHDYKNFVLKDGDVQGTFAYIAPERYRGITRPASDQYSLGIVVYEWLTGSHPFKGVLEQLIYDHIHTPPPALYGVYPQISQEIEAVVMRALAKDPEQRYPSVKEFADALELAIREHQSMPSWWELQTYKGSSEELEKIRAAYEPYLPLPPIGVHKTIAEELTLNPDDVYQAIKAIRLEMNLEQYNDPSLYGLEPISGDKKQPATSEEGNEEPQEANLGSDTAALETRSEPVEVAKTETPVEPVEIVTAVSESVVLLSHNQPDRQAQLTNPATQQLRPVEIFCCYAHTDLYYLERLKTHLSPLQRRGVISTWSDTDISPGMNYEEEIGKHLNSAHVILLLISPDFIASEYCFSKELAQILERHQRGETRVIPIIIRYCSWLETSISKLQALPTGAKPVSSWLDNDQALLDVTLGIKKVIEDLVIKPVAIQEKNLQALSSTRYNEITPRNVPIPNVIIQSPIALCPLCITEFYVGECRILSRTTGEVLKSAPRGNWRQWARKNVEPLISPTYLRQSACRECPHCGYLLPYNIELAESIAFAVIGDTYSGKSHYIASLLHQLQERWLKENSKYVHLTSLTPDREEIDYQHYLNRVFRKRQVLDATQPADPTAPLWPLIYELRINMAPERPLRRFNLVFYDGSGEDYATEERMMQYARHVMYASAIIFLIDPTSIPAILRRLPPDLQNQPATARSASLVINSTIELLERYYGSEAETYFRTVPLAMMLSKSDLIKYTASVAPAYRFLSNPARCDNVDLQDIQAVDEEVRSIIEECKELSLLSASQRFAKVSFFASSATGCAPKRDGTFPFIDPCRCLDPVLWTFQQLGVVQSFIP